MPPLVCANAMIACSFGVAPSMLNVLPVNRTLASGRPAATVFDSKPFVNVSTFGMCTSLANPTVAAATAAALGVLTPMPCVPAIPAPWLPGSPTVRIAGQAALTPMSTCNCSYGGVISVLVPGQMTVQVT